VFQQFTKCHCNTAVKYTISIPDQTAVCLLYCSEWQTPAPHPLSGRARLATQQITQNHTRDTLTVLGKFLENKRT